MAVKVSFVNMKGRVGKSTLAVNLAWEFSARTHWSRKVLLVDLDPQFSASHYMLGTAKYERLLATKGQTVWHVLEHGVHSGPDHSPLAAVHNVGTFMRGARLDLVPSQLELAESLRNPTGREDLLLRFIGAVEDNYDLVLFDCAPTESILTKAAYFSSDMLLIPAKPEHLSTLGFPLVADSLRAFKETNSGSRLEVAGVVFNSTSPYVFEQADGKRAVRAAAGANGWHVFDCDVPYSSAFPASAVAGKPLFRTFRAKAKHIKQFREVAEEFAARTGI